MIDQLLAHAPAPLRQWGFDHQLPIAHAVSAAKMAVKRRELLLDVVDRAVSDWIDKAEKDSGPIDWDNVNEDHAQVVAEDVWDLYGKRLEANYKIPSARALQPLVWASLAKRKETPPTGTSLWTDAPRDYDHRGTFRTKNTFTWLLGREPKVLYQVVIPASIDANWQVQRYQSGNHVALDDARVEQERVLQAKSARMAEFTGQIKPMQGAIAEAADLIPAKYEDGYWQHGIRWTYVADPATGRSYKRPLEHGPMPDPERALATLQGVFRAFVKLPKDVQKEHWRIKADATDLLRIAKRKAGDLRAERDQHAKDNAKAAAAFAKSAAMVTAHLVEKGAPDGVIIVPATVTREGRTTAADGPAYGRVTSWPPVNGILETETGPITLGSTTGTRYPHVTAMKAPEFPVPAAVWKAGATGYGLYYRVIDGAPYWFWGMHGAYKVVDAAGQPVKKNTNVFKAIMAGSIYETQDQFLDRRVAEEVAAHGVPTSWREMSLQHPASRDSKDAILVDVKAPEHLGRGLVGYQVRHPARSATARGDESKVTLWTRLAKPKTPKGPLWYAPPKAE